MQDSCRIITVDKCTPQNLHVSFNQAKGKFISLVSKNVLETINITLTTKKENEKKNKQHICVKIKLFK